MVLNASLIWDVPNYHVCHVIISLSQSGIFRTTTSMLRGCHGKMYAWAFLETALQEIDAEAVSKIKKSYPLRTWFIVSYWCYSWKTRFSGTVPGSIWQLDWFAWSEEDDSRLWGPVRHHAGQQTKETEQKAEQVQVGVKEMSSEGPQRMVPSPLPQLSPHFFFVLYSNKNY